MRINAFQEVSLRFELGEWLDKKPVIIFEDIHGVIQVALQGTILIERAETHINVWVQKIFASGRTAAVCEYAFDMQKKYWQTTGGSVILSKTIREEEIPPQILALIAETYAHA